MKRSLMSCISCQIYEALGSPDTKDHYLSSLRVRKQVPLGLLIYIKILAF